MSPRGPDPLRPPIDLPPAARPFLVDADGAPLLTFAELEASAHRLCRRLTRAGAGPGHLVAARLLNGPALAVALVAAWLAGAAFLPLSPRLTRAETARALRLARPTATLAPGGEIRRPRRLPEPGIEPGDALVLLTSGSTGAPKGVVLTGDGVRAGVGAVRDLLALGEDDRTIDLVPWTHGHGLLGVLLASLQAGGSIVVHDGPATLAAGTRAAEGVTWLSVVPPLMSGLVEAPARNRLRRLRFVRSASAPLPPGLAGQAEETWGCPVAEAYGMTETSHQAAGNPPDLALRRLGTVGRPTGVRIRTGEPAGDGFLLEASGPSLFRGYLRRPDLTAEVTSADGWYRTGDVGVIEADGHVRLLGRVTELINRGGFKVSPAEVEAALSAHPAVRSCLVTAVPHPVLGEEVAALVVPRAGRELHLRELRRHCARLLADHKQPGLIRPVSELPCLPNGKPSRALARRLLTEPRWRPVATPRRDALGDPSFAHRSPAP